VRGGWEGHEPQAATDLFLPALRDAGYVLTIAETLSVYEDAALLAATDLIVACWTAGELSEAQSANLVAAVASGTGFAGWHGGVVAAFTDREYLRMTGGLFLHHPDFMTYQVRVPEQATHPIVDGVSDFTVHTEQYWVLTDALNTTLAETTVEAPDGSRASMPVVWVRQWGAGRVFVHTIGHSLDDLAAEPVHGMIARGLVWASR
jgi:type 1 glutamine amidotransferase